MGSTTGRFTGDAAGTTGTTIGVVTGRFIATGLEVSATTGAADTGEAIGATGGLTGDLVVGASDSCPSGGISTIGAPIGGSNGVGTSGVL